MTARISVGRTSSGDRTPFYRELAWRLGDDHARRLCRLLDWYCRWFGLDPGRFHVVGAEAKLRLNSTYGRTEQNWVGATEITESGWRREMDARSAYPAEMHPGSDAELDREARALLARQAASIDGLDWDRRVLARALQLQREQEGALR